MIINILLATYNSSKYIREQLDSLFAQTYDNFIVYIHDDGSTDSTLGIIEEYKKKFSEKIICLKDSDCKKGACLSFMWLLENTNGSYYMFCDHDDVWLPQKIEKTLEKMIETENLFPNTPILVHTDLKVVDNNLNEIYSSFWKYCKLKQSYLSKFNYLGACNGVTGCTVMINNKAKNISLPVNKKVPMHDYWLALQVAKNGKIMPLDMQTVLYRQHGNNAIGAKNINIFYFIEKIIYFKNTARMQLTIYYFLRNIGYGNILKYIWYKLIYSIIRNM